MVTWGWINWVSRFMPFVLRSFGYMDENLLSTNLITLELSGSQLGYVWVGWTPRFRCALDNLDLDLGNKWHIDNFLPYIFNLGLGNLSPKSSEKTRVQDFHAKHDNNQHIFPIVDLLTSFYRDHPRLYSNFEAI